MFLQYLPNSWCLLDNNLNGKHCHVTSESKQNYVSKEKPSLLHFDIFFPKGTELYQSTSSFPKKNHGYIIKGNNEPRVSEEGNLHQMQETTKTTGMWCAQAHL